MKKKKKSFHSTRVPRKKVSGLAAPLVHSPLTPERYVCGLGSSKITPESMDKEKEEEEVTGRGTGETCYSLKP